MKIYNQDKTEILENPDLTKGYLTKERVLVSEEQQEEFHYEEKCYDNGGVARYKIVDKQYKPAEYEDIQVYTLFTKEALIQFEIEKLDTWFKEKYSMYEQMFTRRKALGIEDVIEDEFRNRVGENAYHNLIELYEEAEIVAKEIRELRS
jgi:hypothetical protein